MNKDFLQKLLSFYTNEKIQFYKRIEHPLANDSYFINTNKENKFVIRILKNQTLEGLKREIKIQKFLLKNNILTPKYLLLEHFNQNYGIVEDTIFCISKYIDGNNNSPVTEKLIKNIGRFLAEFSSSLKSLKLKNKAWLSYETCVHNLEKIQESEIKNRISNTLSNCKVIFESNLPKGIIHGDLMIDNIFIKNKDVTVVFDFEETEENIRILDITRSLIDLSHEGNFDKNLIKRLLIKGYEEIIPLGKREKQLFDTGLKYTAAACSIWFYNNRYIELCSKFLKWT